VLAHLIHEHQVGFANRVIEAAYFTRQTVDTKALTAEQSKALDTKAKELVRYLLFAEEPALPAGGVEGDAAFKTDFLASRRAIPAGASLKDFDLKTRLFRYRCSYMITVACSKVCPTC
jgi:hypothetical protein